jgi:hypothetical protein
MPSSHQSKKVNTMSSHQINTNPVTLLKQKQEVLKSLKDAQTMSNFLATDIGHLQAMVRYLLSLSPKVVSVPEKWEDVEAAVINLGFNSESATVNGRNTFMDAHSSIIRRASEDNMVSKTGPVKRKGSKSKKKQTSA